MEVSQVIRPGLTVDENVIKKDKYKSTQVRPEDVVHEGLERRRRVAEAKWHDEELVEAVMRAEHRLVDILRPHPDLVVPGPQVQLGEETRAVELVEQLVHDRDGEGILDCERVQRPLVDAEPPRAVRLFDEEYRR